MVASPFNLRARFPTLPEDGRILYIDSGDATDMDGYYCAALAEQVAKHTPNLTPVTVVARRLATPDRTAYPNAHNPSFSNECMKAAHILLKKASPSNVLVRGPRNEKNFIPNKFICHERIKYGASLELALGSQIFEDYDASYASMDRLVEMIDDPETSCVVLNILGSSGFVTYLLEHSEHFIAKLKASGLPIVSMNGVLAEQEIKTMPVPGRDPRATMNNLYANPGPLIQAVRDHDIHIVYSTNTATRAAYCYEDDAALIKGLGLTGFMAQLASDWYGEGGHLKNNYVPFDFVTVLSRINKNNDFLKTEKRKLYVGIDNPSVQVLVTPEDHEKDPSDRPEFVQQAIGDDTKFFCTVESVASVDSAAGERLSQEVFAN